MTKTEKIEAQRYNSELYSLTGLRFKCNTLRDYYLIKVLYQLLSIIQDPVILEYYDEVLSVYYDKLKISKPKLKRKIIDKTIEGYYYNYGYTEGLYQYWLKYYYPTCLNFTSFLAIYSGEELPYTVFENTTTTALNKLTKFMEEQSIEMVRNEMSNISIYGKEEGLNISFVWEATNDGKTCKICRDLNGKKFKYAPNLAHPNCRCKLLVIWDEK